jgi:predicted metal-dependent hydrolase
MELPSANCNPGSGGCISSFAKSGGRPLTACVLDLIFGRNAVAPTAQEILTVGARQLPLQMVRHPRARRYLLRLRADGTARVTIPRGGTAGAAREFVQRSLPWLQNQLARLDAHPVKPADWHIGTEILFRGQLTRLAADAGGRICFAGESVKVSGLDGDLRPAIERHLRRLAARELPVRVMELAAQHGLTVSRVSVRNQRTRWGSCSRRATISLNWRLIQTPTFVRDYICLHELAHLREMNHGERFWRQVERLCPDYRTAEAWLKQNSGLLR